MRINLGSEATRISRQNEPRTPRWLRPVLEVPLEAKLLGANLMIVGVAVLLLFGPVHLQLTLLTDAYIVVVALILGATVNFGLVRLALGPIKSIERVGKWVSQGRLGERVPASMVADRRLARLSTTINELLDRLAVDRKRMEKLSAEVAEAEAKERSQVARELDDSLCTKLVDASLQIAAAENEMESHARSSRLTEARELLRTAMDEIRTNSRSSRPNSVLGSGVPKSLEAPGAATRQGSPTDVWSAVGIPRATLRDRRTLMLGQDVHEVKASNGTRQG
jgi:signal transduction histidine kinase